MNIKVIRWALMVLALSIGFAPLSRADEVYQIDPGAKYPAVWGRFLPEPPDGAFYWPGVKAVLGANNKVHILFRSKKTHFSEFWKTTQKAGEVYGVLDFFSGEVRYGPQAVDDIYRKYAEANGDLKELKQSFERPRWHEFYFSGPYVGMRSEGNCYLSLSPRFSYYDINPITFAQIANTEHQRQIILRRDRPRLIELSPDCYYEGPKRPYYERYLALGSKVLPLGDGTILALAMKGNVAIRITPELTSPFIDNKRLFLVDARDFQEQIDWSVDIFKAQESAEEYLKDTLKNAPTRN